MLVFHSQDWFGMGGGALPASQVGLHLPDAHQEGSPASDAGIYSSDAHLFTVATLASL